MGEESILTPEDGTMRTGFYAAWLPNFDLIDHYGGGMRRTCILLLSALVCACGTYNAADTMALRDDVTTDMARCGAGLGIDNKVGLIIKGESQKSGGELSAQQSSEIRAKAVTEGLMSGDGKNYDAYLKCILELDRRRSDRKTSELMERIQQPALKV